MSELARQRLAQVAMASRPELTAATLEKLAPELAAAALLAQTEVVSANILERMLPQLAARVIVVLADKASAVVAKMSPPRAAASLRWLSEGECAAVLDALEGVRGRELRESLSYPANTAGSLMDPRVYIARSTDTAEQALERIRGVRKALYQICVVDDQQVLLGVIPIQDLAVADAKQRVGSLVSSKPEVVDAFADRDDVAELLAVTATPSIPVVDAEGHLLGALRHRALLGIAEEEAAAMMQQMVGAGSEERALSPVLLAVKKRLPWLHINLLTAFLAAAVVGVFENTIAQVTSLAILLPVVAGQSGNSGSQALAVTMRGLALREIRGSHWPRVAAKELMVGLTNGIAISLVTAAGVFVWSGSFALAGVIAAAMVMSMAAAGVAGASVPIVLKRLGQDPAQSSSIILTTVTDVVGFSSFLGLATILVDQLV